MAKQIDGKILISKIAFFLTTFGLVASIYITCIFPIYDFRRSERDALTKRYETLARLNTLISRRSDIVGSSKQLTDARTTFGFLTGVSDGAINANLQSILRRTVAQNGALLRSIRTMPTRPIGRIQYAGAHIEFTGSMPVILRCIKAIEEGLPVLRITGAVFRTSPMPTVTNADMTIEVQLDVFGAVESKQAT